MKKLSMILVAIVMMAGFSMKVVADDNSKSTLAACNAGAKIIVPMALVNTVPLYFGTINILSGAGTCILNSHTAARDFADGLVASAVLPAATNAIFTVAGTKNETYAITLPGDGDGIHVTEAITPTQTMSITGFKAYVTSKTAEAVTGTLNGTGHDGFTVGATLNVLATNIGGIYSGTYPVTVDYN